MRGVILFVVGVVLAILVTTPAHGGEPSSKAKAALALATPDPFPAKSGCGCGCNIVQCPGGGHGCECLTKAVNCPCGGRCPVCKCAYDKECLALTWHLCKDGRYHLFKGEEWQGASRAPMPGEPTYQPVRVVQCSGGS